MPEDFEAVEEKVDDHKLRKQLVFYTDNRNRKLLTMVFRKIAVGFEEELEE